MQVVETADKSGLRRQYKIANRDLYGLDFRWIDEAQIVSETLPEQLLVLERIEHGDFYGTLKQIKTGKKDSSPATMESLQQELLLVEQDLKHLDELEEKLNAASYRMEQLRLDLLKLDYKEVPADDIRRQRLANDKAQLDSEFAGLITTQTNRLAAAREAKAIFADSSGQEKEIVLADIFQVYAPNQMSLSDKLIFYGHKLIELLTGEPRESNTEGACFRRSSAPSC